MDRRDLTAYLSGVGFSLQASDEVLHKLETKQLITPAIISAERDSDHRRFRLTSLGSFHLHYLCHVFQYLDAMTLDTPILDTVVRKVMVDTISIHERVDRTKVFLDYLDKSVADIRDDAMLAFWEEHSIEARSRIDEIEKRI